ncbi:glutathione S-transferase-like [Apium graveolens]|uniref:glutathione S-transferase-like n=1 Tax=Apium graveolens TaxID=4045 RepID=UPI003D7AF788
MGGIKVHGIKISTCSQRVFAALYEKGIDFELVPVDMQNGEHKKPPFLSLNPFGQIPAFEDGDVKLFESRAITQYIAYAYADKGNPLVVIEDQKKMAVVSVWMQVESQQFDAAAARLAWELVFKPMFGKETDNAAVEEHEAKLAKVLDIYESRLTESKYLGGDCFSLADLHHLPVMKYLMGTRVAKLLESRSHVNDWFADIQARPSWQKVLSM